MRIHRVQIEGFGPFREAQNVDFDALAPQGIFVIAGRTGAGKSSILDAICFALYGVVPRYDGSERRLRSDHCAPEDPTSVVLEFSAGAARWRLTRCPEYERPKRRGEGTTLVAAEALLERFEDGQWVGHAAGPREVGHAIDEVVGLSHQQFLQVILLAQNRFSQFLLSGNADRQRLLRTLFGTRVYEDYEKRLDERRRDSERERERDAIHRQRLVDDLDALAREAGWVDDSGAPTDSGAPDDSGAPADGAPDDFERAAARGSYEVQTREEQVERADARRAAAEDAHARRRELRAQQESREQARARLAALDAAAAILEPERARVATARAAERLRAPLHAAAATAQAAQSAKTVVDSCVAAAPPGLDTALDPDALGELAQQLTGEIARWQDAAVVEERLDVDRAELADAETERGALEGAANDLALSLDRIAADRESVRRDIDALSASAASRDALRAECDDLEVRLAASAEADALATLLERARGARAASAADVEKTVAEWGVLMRRRLAGHAAELAADLHEGEPCPVCGSAEHPAPAPAAPEPVTDATLAEAEAARDTALATDRDAAAHEAQVQVQLDAARARARARTPDLELARSAAASRLDEAERAAAKLDEARSLELRLADQEQSGVLRQAELAARIGELSNRVAVLQARIADGEAAVGAARGEFATVHARMAAATALRDAAVRLAEARIELHRADRLAAEAEDALAQALAASPFADAAAARAALVDPDEQDDIDSRLREHDAAVRVAKERLLDLELRLADAPLELVDLDETLREATTAREQWQQGVAALAEARERLARLGQVRARLDELDRDSAERDERHRVLARLADTVAGRAPNALRMTLETFVLAAELEEIVAAANLRLDEMSDGRYRLEHTDALARRNAASGLGLQVYDAHTGRSRPPQSLSGGETFLASLALALGLAEVVTSRAGGVRLDTLFIDEGFGALDADTLELALRTLDDLRSGGRTVGVISHVETMKEQLPIGIVVEATPRGPSVIREPAVRVPA